MKIERAAGARTFVPLGDVIVDLEIESVIVGLTAVGETRVAFEAVVVNVSATKGMETAQQSAVHPSISATSRVLVGIVRYRTILDQAYPTAEKYHRITPARRTHKRRAGRNPH